MLGSKKRLRSHVTPTKEDDLKGPKPKARKTSSKPGARTSPSPVPSPAPSSQAAQNRGYVGELDFKGHYPYAKFADISKWLGAEVEMLPDKGRGRTTAVPSIPAVFASLLSALSRLEHEARKRSDILSLADKRILRPTVGSEAKSKSAPTVTDVNGKEFLVNACRKEHVKLIYEGPDHGMLRQLGLCARLVNVYLITPGNTQCVGGPDMDPTIPCTCSRGADGRAPSPALAPAATTTDASATAHFSEDEMGDDDAADDFEDAVPEAQADLDSGAIHLLNLGSDAKPHNGTDKAAAADVDMLTPPPSNPDRRAAGGSSSSTGGGGGGGGSVSEEFSDDEETPRAAESAAPVLPSPAPVPVPVTRRRRRIGQSDALDAQSTSSARGTPAPALGDAKDVASEDDAESDCGDATRANEVTSGEYWAELEKNIQLIRKSVEKSTRRKTRELERVIEQQRQEMTDVSTSVNEWKQKYQQERDLNVKLQERITKLSQVIDRVIKK